MHESDVIIVDNIPNQDYNEMALAAFRYAIISVGFTFNRMDKSDLSQRITNITKGKISESLFYYFCFHNDIHLDSQSCTTPFWAPDQKDFLYLKGEWDIKNNFIYPERTPSLNYVDLPALIPNKFSGDQWSKRDRLHFKNTRFGAYLFSFMAYAKGNRDFFSYEFTDKHLELLLDISVKYKGTGFGGQPFAESWFWDEFDLDTMKYNFILKYYPALIITACSNLRYWHLFEDTSFVSNHDKYQDYGNSKWYLKNDKVLKFLDGTLVTKIKNKTCPVSLLPSFASLHPHLNDGMQFARFKT
jgi:hypothetical protein